MRLSCQINIHLFQLLLLRYQTRLSSNGVGISAATSTTAATTTQLMKGGRKSI